MERNKYIIVINNATGLKSSILSQSFDPKHFTMPEDAAEKPEIKTEEPVIQVVSENVIEADGRLSGEIAMDKLSDSSAEEFKKLIPTATVNVATEESLESLNTLNVLNARYKHKFGKKAVGRWSRNAEWLKSKLND